MTRQEEANAMIDNTHMADHVNYVLQKLARDFIVNIAIAAPAMVVAGEFQPTLFLPTLGLAAYRTVRDVLVPMFEKAK